MIFFIYNSSNENRQYLEPCMKVSLFSSILLFFLLSLPLSRGLGAWQTISDVQFFSNDRPALIVTQQPDELHDQYFCQIFSVDLQSKIAKPLFSSLKECQHPLVAKWRSNCFYCSKRRGLSPLFI